MKILFVCSGNISRSFLAEVLCRQELERRPDLDIEVRSAGLLAIEGNTPDEEMTRYLKENGIPVPDHGARLVGQADVDWADRIFAMDFSHVRLLGRFSNALEKTDLLGNHVPGERVPKEIKDPWGLSPFDYEQCQAQIAAGVKAVLEGIEKRKSDGARQGAQPGLQSER